MSLEEAQLHMAKAFNLYLQNKFREGMAMAEQHHHYSMYHSAMKSIFLTIAAALSMETVSRIFFIVFNFIQTDLTNKQIFFNFDY